MSSLLRRALVAVAILGLLGSVTSAAPASAQAPRLFVVGDSVILGAESAIRSTLGANWDVVFDAAVSRSTSAGAAVIAARKHEIGDTVVVQLGTNDAGTISVFEARIDEVMQQLADVPNVVWVNIREVRDYYPAANQALRNAEARWPNLTVADWNAYSSGVPDPVYEDGLHLTGTGAQGMANMLAEQLGSPTGSVVAPAPGASAQSPVTPAATGLERRAFESMVVMFSLAGLHQAAAEAKADLARAVLDATTGEADPGAAAVTPPLRGGDSLEGAALRTGSAGEAGTWLWVGGAVLAAAMLAVASLALRRRYRRSMDPRSGAADDHRRVVV
ncbi:MAG: hypothetical protein EDR02_06185 [Actinobacteria bacterium]|nr:MAG: hypothetical protein EDR02_06185 [Actinomycetota bacterium]